MEGAAPLGPHTQETCTLAQAKATNFFVNQATCIRDRNRAASPPNTHQEIVISKTRNRHTHDMSQVRSGENREIPSFPFFPPTHFLSLFFPASARDSPPSRKPLLFSPSFSPSPLSASAALSLPCGRQSRLESPPDNTPPTERGSGLEEERVSSTCVLERESAFFWGERRRESPDWAFLHPWAGFSGEDALPLSEAAEGGGSFLLQSWWSLRDVREWKKYCY